METIKCPICGSVHIEPINNDKYHCLACENDFTVYDHSKEFRETDDHIEDIRSDIQKLGNDMKTSGSGNDYRLKEIAFEADKLYSEGNYTDAYINYKKYAAFNSASYFGHWGMYKSLTKDFNRPQISNPAFNDGFDQLSLALNAADCPANIKSKAVSYVSANIKADIEQQTTDLCNGCGLAVPSADSKKSPALIIDDLIHQFKEQVRMNNETIEQYKQNPKKPYTISQIIFIIILGLLTLYNISGVIKAVGIFGKIFFIVLTCITGFLCVCLISGQTRDADIKQLNQKNQDLENGINTFNHLAENANLLNALDNGYIKTAVSSLSKQGKTAEAVYQQMRSENAAAQEQKEKEKRMKELNDLSMMLQQNNNAASQPSNAYSVFTTSRKKQFSIPNDQLNMLVAIYNSKGKVQAVKEARRMLGLDMRDAKELIDAL